MFISFVVRMPVCAVARWTQADPGYVPPEIDTTKPSVARVYDTIIARFFDGFDLVPPGLVYLAEWRADEPVRLPLNPGSMLMPVGVGRKP